ncbi:MAG: FAD-dependent oxidoreductase [Promethearchaeota archaeon]
MESETSNPSSGEQVKRVVIVGNGIGGVMVASRLRALSKDLTIEIYTREPYEYYSRIRLPEICCTNMTAEDLAVYKPGWYAQRNVAVYKNSEVVAIDRERKEIVLKSGARVPYDKLVLATGADSFKPPIPNVDLDGVFTIREYGDAEAIREYLGENREAAVVVGGGLLGLESARHIKAAGVARVVVVEIMPRLLPKQLDEKGAALLKKIIERMGCEVVLGATVEAIEGERRATGVRLKDERSFPAQTVLISAGIRPRVELAKAAGLEVNRGVVVDDHLRSSDPDVYVVGDLVEFKGIVWGIIPAALDHANVVAHNIAGDAHVRYRQTIPKNTLKVADVYLTSLGKVVLDEEEVSSGRYVVLDALDEEGERYEKYVMEGDRLVGAILLGSRDNVKWAAERVGKATKEGEVRERLAWSRG